MWRWAASIGGRTCLCSAARSFNSHAPAAATSAAELAARADPMVSKRARRPPPPPPLGIDAAAAAIAAAAAGAPPPRPVSAEGAAAVLVPLFASPADGDVHVILTRRAAHMKTHAGEVCLPGGRRDAADADDAACALREAFEECGIEPREVRVVAALPPLLSKHKLSVTPVVGVVPPGLRFAPNPAEVDAVFTAPLRRFLEAGPGYSWRDVEWAPGVRYRLHQFDHAHGGEVFPIWGLTAGVLVVVAQQAYGRRAAFALDPPGSAPYSSLAWERGRLVFRGGAARAGSAAHAGAAVSDEEAEAAVG